MQGLASFWPTVLPDSKAATHGWTLTWVVGGITLLVIAAFVALGRTTVSTRWPAEVRRRARGIVVGVLGLGAALAVVTYHDFGLSRYGTYLNEWDIYHYYLGSKYAPEIGYMDLYATTLVADRETGLRYEHPSGQIRDLRSTRTVAADAVLADGERYRRLFSPGRWSEFVADVAWLKAELPADRWGELYQDHGYNGTPAWSFVVGGLITRHLSIRSPIQRWIMLLLDPLLIVLTLACVAWAFDLPTALFMVVFMGTHYLLSWGHLKGALLRTDFAMCVVLAACFLKKGRPQVAGVFMGWAILSRLFPVLFLVGPGALLAVRLVKERRLDRPLLLLFAACGVTVAVVVLASLIGPHGLSLWHEWAEKITKHYASLSDWNIGYQPLTDVDFVKGVPTAIDIRRRLAEEPNLRLEYLLSTWGARALVLIPALYFMRTLEPHESLCCGFVFVFFCVAPTYYYYVILAVPLLFFASRVDRPTRAAGLALLIGTGLAGYLLFRGIHALQSFVPFQGWKQAFPTYYYMSWLIGLSAAYMVLLAALHARQVERSAALSGESRPQLNGGGAGAAER